MTEPRRVAIVLALVVALCAPFSGKAFHIDEPFFLAIAENVRRHPLRPYDGAVALDDTDHRVFAERRATPNTFETLSHPPLVPYVIAAVTVASGGVREAPQHAAFLLFALLAAWSQYRLARRFTARPLPATLFLVSSPIFALTAQSLMTDMPALALSLAALALFVEGVDSGRSRLVLLSGVSGGLAMLARYVALALVPLAVVYVISRRVDAKRAALALVPLGLVVGAWCVQNRVEHGAIHLTAAARHYVDYYAGRYWGGADLTRRAVCDLSALGGTAFPAAGLVLLAARGSGAWSLFAACLAASAAVVVLDPFGLAELGAYSAKETLGLVGCLATGAFLVAVAIRQGLAASADRRFLALWLVGALAGTIVLLPFGTARYMLFVLPPLALLACAAPHGPASPRFRAGAALALVATLALAGALVLADFEYAGAYRAFAAQVPGYSQNRPAWFQGDWGFRCYMERAGHRYLLSDDESPREGDIVVRPQLAGLHDMSPRLRERAELVATVEIPSRVPLRLMSAEAKAGFYSHGWGLLPFALSRLPLERFDVYRVVAAPRP